MKQSGWERSVQLFLSSKTNQLIRPSLVHLSLLWAETAAFTYSDKLKLFLFRRVSIKGIERRLMKTKRNSRKLFLVKGAFFKSAIRRLDKFFVILKPIKVLSVADPRPNQVGVRFGLVSVSLRSRFGLVSVSLRSCIGGKQFWQLLGKGRPWRGGREV